MNGIWKFHETSDIRTKNYMSLSSFFRSSEDDLKSVIPMEHLFCLFCGRENLEYAMTLFSILTFYLIIYPRV